MVDGMMMVHKYVVGKFSVLYNHASIQVRRLKLWPTNVSCCFTYEANNTSLSLSLFPKGKPTKFLTWAVAESNVAHA